MGDTVKDLGATFEDLGTVWAGAEDMLVDIKFKLLNYNILICSIKVVHFANRLHERID